jgi:hypothetical protein
MTRQILALTAYTEEQRRQAHERFGLIRPFLELTFKLKRPQQSR